VRPFSRAGGSAFERVYSVVVAGKGLYGLVELLAGLALLVAPGASAGLLTGIAAELAEGTSPLRDAAARSLSAAGGGIAAGAVPLALFFLVHGVVKLLTVTALLRRAVRWYPWAFAALIVLLVVQLVDLVVAPALGGVVLTVLDVLVLVVIAWEWRRLVRAPALAAEEAPARVRSGEPAAR
jgi:uncharacterized membrane protein